MASSNGRNKGFTVTAHQGDAKTLLAFNFDSQEDARNLAGFTIQCQPSGQPAYYLLNMLRFENPAAHAQVSTELPTSTINAPIRKFRWLHVPGSFHQGTEPSQGPYTYTATPRYFDQQQSMLPIDPSLSASVTVPVQPFQSGAVQLGFTRGYTQSQAFVHHFGLRARIQPSGRSLLFDTSQASGKDDKGVQYTFQDEYKWLGYTARTLILGVLDEVLSDQALRLDMLAYDFNEPDVADAVLRLAAQGRVRLILDNAALHHNAQKPTLEDQLEAGFRQQAKAPADILRGHFDRFAHDKIMIVSQQDGQGGTVPRAALTGSTNFSVTGLYVNSNHVLLFTDPAVAKTYSEVFETCWNDRANAAGFRTSPLAGQPSAFPKGAAPGMEVTFSPHDPQTASQVLGGIADRVEQEGRIAGGSVLFAVMEIGTGQGPVYPALRDLHENQNVFSYGVTDTTDGICLYSRGHRTGVLVTGRPAKAKLPPPFAQVPGVGIGHQIHHKFIVCGFNRDDAVVYCGSSNLALGGETQNGDNLLAVHDRDVATAFAVEAVVLVDHFEFLDRASGGNPAGAVPRSSSKVDLAASAGWFLPTDDTWVAPYYDPNDLNCADRLLFA